MPAIRLTCPQCGKGAERTVAAPNGDVLYVHESTRDGVIVSGCLFTCITPTDEEEG